MRTELEPEEEADNFSEADLYDVYAYIYPLPCKLQSALQTWNVFSIPKYWSKIADISTYPYET